MRVQTTLTIAALVCCLGFLPACSTTGAKTGNADISDINAQSGQTTGLGDENSLLTAEERANRLKAPYNQTYYFEFDKDTVLQDDIASINVQAGYLVAHPNAKVRLEGNADDRGSREYNVALGWRRAKAVSAILAQQGVSQKQIVMISYGKEKPVAFGHDDTSYQKNRRVNLVYEAK